MRARYYSSELKLFVNADSKKGTISNSPTPTGKIMTIYPTANLADATTYLIVITGVNDIYGQTLAPIVRRFTIA